MIILQRECIEGRVSDFSFEFWRTIPQMVYTILQNETKQNDQARYNKTKRIMQIYFLIR